MVRIENLLKALFFVAPMAVLLLFSTVNLVLKSTYVIDHAQSFDSARRTEFSYNCHSLECEACLENIRTKPNLVTFTGSSTQKSAIDTATMSENFRRPVQNCGIGGSRMEDFMEIFNQQIPNQKDQDIFHGYTYWEVNRREPIYAGIQEPKASFELKEYLPLLTEYLNQTQLNLRFRLSGLGVPDEFLLSPFLSPEVWEEERLLAQKRRFYFRLFGDGTVGHVAEMQERVNQFIESQKPFRRLVFFTSPDYRPVLHNRTDPEIVRVVDAAISLVADRHDNVFHVVLSGESCGLNFSDYWYSQDMKLDPFHPNSLGRTKFTACFIEKLKSNDLL